jgi:hypothetical protein
MDNLTPCTYCGAIAGTRDHVPPKVIRGMLRETVPGWEKQYPPEVVPACLECNVLLNKEALLTVVERKAWIKKKLRRRYARLLAMPEWSEEELQAVPEGFLKQHLLAKLVQKKWIIARLRW